MRLCAVKNDGVRRARSCAWGLSTIATLIERPEFDGAPLSPPLQQPARTDPPIVNRIAIKHARTASLTLSCSYVLEEPRIATERHGQIRDRCGPAAAALGMSLRWSTYVKLTRHLEAAAFAEAATTVRSQVTVCRMIWKRDVIVDQTVVQR